MQQRHSGGRLVCTCTLERSECHRETSVKRGEWERGSLRLILSSGSSSVGSDSGTASSGMAVRGGGRGGGRKERGGGRGERGGGRK